MRCLVSLSQRFPDTARWWHCADDFGSQFAPLLNFSSPRPRRARLLDSALWRVQGVQGPHHRRRRGQGGQLIPGPSWNSTHMAQKLRKFNVRFATRLAGKVHIKKLHGSRPIDGRMVLGVFQQQKCRFRYSETSFFLMLT